MDPKRKAVKTHKENEAIQFDFDITADDFDEIANEMMKSGLILEEDSRAVAKLLKVQCYTLIKDRKERIAQAQTAAREKEMAKLQQALEQHHQQLLVQQQQQAQTQTSIEGQQHQSQNQIPTSQQGPQIISNFQNQQPQIQQISPQPQPISQQQQQQQQMQANQSPMMIHNQQMIPQQQLHQQQMTPNLMPQQPINLVSTPNQQQQQQQTPLKPPDSVTHQQQQVTPTNVQQQPIQKLPPQNQQLQGASVPIANQNPPPAVNQEISKTPQPKTSDSGLGSSTPQSVSSTGSTLKKRRAGKSSERYPKLVVLGLTDEKIVECEMEVKPKTVTFKFDVFEVNPDEVAKDLVKLLFFY